MIRQSLQVYAAKILVFLFFVLSSCYVNSQPVTGEITKVFSIPKNQKTFFHTQDSGSDRLLVVITQNPNGVNATSVTYNGAALSTKANWRVNGWQNRIWYIEDPEEGTNDLAISFSGNQGDKCAYIALSFTNAVGLGQVSINKTGEYNVLQSVMLNVGAYSKIIGTGLSGGAGAADVLRLSDSMNLAFEWNNALCCGKGSFGGVSGSLSNGNHVLSSRVNSGYVYPIAIEVLGAGPLSINLIDFTSTRTKENFVRLDWRTASEVNNDYFLVERSKNIEEWEDVVTLNGSGNSNVQVVYSVIDNNPYFGKSFYRLKQTDFDGKSDFSPITSVYIAENRSLEIAIHPNPTQRYITIDAIKGEIGADILVFSPMGKDVSDQVFIDYQVNKTTRIDMVRLGFGVYYLKIKNEVFTVFFE